MLPIVSSSYVKKFGNKFSFHIPDNNYHMKWVVREVLKSIEHGVRMLVLYGAQIMVFRMKATLFCGLSCFVLRYSWPSCNVWSCFENVPPYEYLNAIYMHGILCRERKERNKMRENKEDENGREDRRNSKRTSDDPHKSHRASTKHSSHFAFLSVPRNHVPKEFSVPSWCSPVRIPSKWRFGQEGKRLESPAWCRLAWVSFVCVSSKRIPGTASISYSCNVGSFSAIHRHKGENVAEVLPMLK